MTAPDDAPILAPYANRGGHSGVAAYACADDAITVRFTDGSTYVYTATSVGRTCLDEMQRLAARGIGLNTFINRAVHGAYATKLS